MPSTDPDEPQTLLRDEGTVNTQTHKAPRLDSLASDPLKCNAKSATSRSGWREGPLALPPPRGSLLTSPQSPVFMRSQAAGARGGGYRPSQDTMVGPAHSRSTPGGRWVVSITHVLSASSLAPSQLSWAASRQGTEEWPERSPRGDGIGPEGRPAGCTLGWQGRKAPCGLRSRGGGGARQPSGGGSPGRRSAHGALHLAVS